MASNYTPRNFAIQQVFEILLCDVKTKSPIAYLDDPKTSGLTNEQTMVYPTGGRGNVYIGGGFGHSRRASLSVTNATWNTGVMGLQIGSEVIIGSNKDALHYEKIEYDGSKLKTKYKAQGTAGKEIGIMYSVKDDGSYFNKYTQVEASPEAGQFTYSSTTGEITLGGETSLTKGDKFAVSYCIDTGDSAQTIAVAAAGQPKTALVTCMGLVKDVETGEFYQCQIQGLAQISGAWAWDLAADGEPASQSLDIEFVKKYSEKNLYDIIIWNEEDAQVIS